MEEMHRARYWGGVLHRTAIPYLGGPSSQHFEVLTNTQSLLKNIYSSPITQPNIYSSPIKPLATEFFTELGL